MASYKTSNASVYVPATVAPKPATSAISKTYSAPPPASSPVSAKTPLPNITLGQTAPYKAGQTPGPSTTTYYSGSTPITAPLLTAQQPVNLTTGSFGGGSVGVGTTGTGGSGAGITGGTLGYNASVAGSIGNEYTRDANGNWVLNQQNPNAQVDNLPDYIKQNIPQKESLYAQPEYQQAQQQYEQARQRQRQYSDQIATITNIANAKALSLQGQGRGIPEAIIGGQQAQIYKEAAIQALPIQSQLAIAQGDTQAAQEHLKTLTEYLTESVQNKFEADKMRYSAVVGYMTEKEKQYTTQLLSEKKALTDAQSEAFDTLAKAGVTSGAAYNEVQNAKSVKQVAMVKAKYGGGGGITTPSGLSPESQNILNSVKNLRFSSVEESKRIQSNIANRLASGDMEGAISDLQQFGYEKLSAAQKGDYDLYSSGISAFESSVQQLKDSKINAGPYKALFEKAKPWVAIQKDKQYADLRSVIELGQAQIRKGFYGTAVTSTEAGNARNFLIVDSDPADVMMWKMDNAANFLQYANDATIARQVGLPKPKLDDYLTYRVKQKTTGKTGSIPRSEYSAKEYEIIAK